MIKVIIAGGRDFDNYQALEAKCDKYLCNIAKTERIQIVCGEANGADKLGKRYAKNRRYSVKLFPANWDLFGPAAGPLRNGEMADYASVLIAFWDGKSKGTADMIKQAKINKLIVRIVKYR